LGMSIRAAVHTVIIGAAILAALARPVCAYDLIFDYTSFGSTFGQSQFDVLNYPGINGRYMNTSTDNHRGEMVANNNELAQFYNSLTDRYVEQTVKNGAAAADVIHQYTINNSYDEAYDPPRPKWIVLNEISPSLWSANQGSPSLSTYRTWLIDCVTRLTAHHGYNVVTLAPFQNPAQNNASWQALSGIANSYIGIECYLSGTEVWNSGADNAARLAWAQAQYQASKNSYLNRGVPENKLFVTEHFANNDVTYVTAQGNVATTHWGRSGLASAADWDTVIQIRQDAIYNVGFDGFLAYNWGGNGMGVIQAEQIQHEYYYRSRRVLASQKPQWLSDAAINVNGTVIPLSWNQPLNWLGDVPNATGAEVNFWRTLSSDRTITLDGDKTIGTLTFDSSEGDYTISPGTGGGLTFRGAGGSATLISDAGNHNIGADVQLADSLNAAVNAGTLTMSRPVSGAGGLTKTGAATFVLGAANTYAGATDIQAGVLRVGNTLTSPGGTISIGPLGRLEASSIVQRTLVNNGVVAAPAAPAVLALAGSVSGAGSFTGNVRIDGELSPGNGVGSVSFQHLRLNNQATLEIELGAAHPAQYDRVAATGSLMLDGQLNVTLVVGFTPSAGNSFNILEWGSLAGTFDELYLPELDPGLMWNASQLYVDGTLRIALAGDFDFNDVVDADDLLQWKSAYGASGSLTPTLGDADGDRDVDGADFLAWQRNVGMTLETAPGTPVPEPAGSSLLALAAIAYAIRRRRSPCDDDVTQAVMLPDAKLT
jgi:autotransporter-associated beta strand protein